MQQVTRLFRIDGSINLSDEKEKTRMKQRKIKILAAALSAVALGCVVVKLAVKANENRF